MQMIQYISAPSPGRGGCAGGGGGGEGGGVTPYCGLWLNWLACSGRGYRKDCHIGIYFFLGL